MARVAREEKLQLQTRVVSATRGHGRVMSELKHYRRLISNIATNRFPADLIVAAVDGNCTTANRRRAEIRDALGPELEPRLVAACPDPHIERWYLADPESFEAVVGNRPEVGAQKCARGHYKRILRVTVQQGGHPPGALGGDDFAPEPVRAMDLERASRRDSSLGAFLRDLRPALRLLASSS